MKTTRILSIGRRMRLCYFATPYELLDVNRPGQDRHFTREGKDKVRLQALSVAFKILKRVCPARGVVSYDLCVKFCIQI